MAEPFCCCCRLSGQYLCSAVMKSASRATPENHLQGSFRSKIVRNDDNIVRCAPYGVRTHGGASGRGLGIGGDRRGLRRGMQVPRYNRGNVDQVYQHTVPRAPGDRATPFGASLHPPVSPRLAERRGGYYLMCYNDTRFRARSGPARSKARQPFRQLWRSLAPQTHLRRVYH